MVKQTNHQIAVVGLGCYYPGANNLKSFWENIVARRRQFRQFPEQRLPLYDYVDETQQDIDKTYAVQAGVLEGFRFDWVRKRIPKKTFESTDIVHWLALDVALQALNDAGLDKTNLPNEKTGVILGNTLTGEHTRAAYMRQRWPVIERTLYATASEFKLSKPAIHLFLERAKEYYLSLFPPMTEDSLAGGLSNTIAGRICNALDAHGGGYTVDGACASSLIAVATAADKLVNGTLDVALAGGVDVSLDTFEMVGFARTGALTPDEMRVYDRRGNGFIPGEGCGFTVLKRLEDAKRDGDYVYAVLNGWGISSDGRGGITAPNGNYQAVALERAYEMAGYSASELDFVEGHGTGTTVGDREELKGVAKAVGSQANELRHCGMTSFKSIVGHTKAAAGIGGFIKAIMAVNQRVIPPTAHCEIPNPFFATPKASNIYPILLGEERPSSDTLKAGVSAMGFGGINSHVTLSSSDAPSQKLKPDLAIQTLLANVQTNELFVIAAENIEALEQQVDRLMQQSSGMSIAELPDLASQWNQSQSNGAFRVAIITSHPRTLQRQLTELKTYLTTDFDSPVTQHLEKHDIYLGYQQQKTRLGFVFTGQGSQQLNSARNLVRRFQWARDHLAQTENILQQTGWSPKQSLEQLLYRETDKALDDAQLVGWKHELKQTNVAQPAICFTSSLWLERLHRLGLEPTVVAGHSLGELGAFYAAGALDYKAYMKLAALRGQAMQPEDNALSGAMAVLMCSAVKAQSMIAAIQDYVVIANINSSKQTVIAGDENAIEQAIQASKTQNIHAQKIPVSNAFHSWYMQEASDGLREQAELPKRLKNNIPIISGMTGQVLEQGIALNEHFSDQVLAQVDFVSVTKTLRQSCDSLVEVGTGRILSNMVQQTDASFMCLPVESQAMDESDLNRLLAHYFVQGGKINWAELYDSRLIRSFIPASEKHFIENPVERPFNVEPTEKDFAALFAEALEEESMQQLTIKSMPAAKSLTALNTTINQEQDNTMNTVPEHLTDPAAMNDEHPITALLLDLVVDKTGFPKESLGLELKLLDDLNLDSIKAAEIIGEAVVRLNIQQSIDPVPLANDSIGDIAKVLENAVNAHSIIEPSESMSTTTVVNELDFNVPAPSATESDKKQVAYDALLSLIEASTGFPKDSLTSDLRLLDDLNLDSIKAAELIGQASIELGLQGEIDPAPLANLSLDELAEVLTGDHSVVSPLSEEHVTNDVVEVVPQNNDTQIPWVRNFTMTMQPEALDLPEQSKLVAGSEAIVICERTEIDLARALAKRFQQSGIKTNAASFKAIRERSDLLEKDSRYIIVILPREAETIDAEVTLQTMVQRLAAISGIKSRQQDLSVVLVQFSGGDFALNTTPHHLESSGILAFASSLHLEQKDLQVRAIDFMPTIDAEDFAAQLTQELQTTDTFKAIGFNEVGDRACLKPALHQLNLDKALHLDWHANDVVLVTGGAKGVTAECALAFAKQTGVSMALVGSSPLPDSTDSNSEINQTLERFRTEGIKAQYYACNLSQGNAVIHLITEILQSLGQVTGVIHGAAINQPSPLSQVSAQEAYGEVSPKVLGAMYLCQALDEVPVKLFAGITSIIGVTGMQGNGWYGFSNEVMDNVLAQYAAKHPATHVVTTAFSVWSEVGMGVRMGSTDYLAKMGIEAIPPRLGVERFVHSLTHKTPTRQTVIAARLAGLDTWSVDEMPRPKVDRFLETIVYQYSQVEVVAQAHLNLDKDYYIKDHVWKGSYLFPTVFGLEAMAQAAAYAVGETTLANVRIEDIVLERPIVVSETDGLNIQIHAKVLEQTIDNQNPTIQVSISTEQTQYTVPCFSARFILGAAQGLEGDVLKTVPEFPVKPLDINPKTDLYSWLLFQGELYQRIESIHYLTDKHCMFAARIEEGDGTRWLLGSPFVRDAFLQSVQPMVPQHISLPIRIDALNIANAGQELPDTVVGVAVNEELVDCEYRTSVHVVSDAGMIERLDGYRLRILEEHDDYPTASMIADAATADEEQLKAKLQHYQDVLKITTPQTTLKTIRGLDDLSREQRREQIKLLLENWQAGKTLQWSEEGKPNFIEGDIKTPVSMSHHQNHLLAVCNENTVGCDLEKIQEKTEQEWLTLLGDGFANALQVLQEKGDSLALAGTRLWSVREACFKALGEFAQTAEIRAEDDTGVIFDAQSKDGEISVLTFPMRFAHGVVNVVAVTVMEQERSHSEVLNNNIQDDSEISNNELSIAEENISVKNILPLENSSFLSESEVREAGYCPAHHYIGLRKSEVLSDTPVFVQRTPLLYKDSQSISRTVYFSNFFLWMGKVREVAMSPVLHKISKQLITSKWGLVTNHTKLQIVGDATASDVIETHLWSSHTFGNHDSTFDLFYDWRKILPDGQYERVAYGEMRVSWVKILDHGVVEPEPLPAYLSGFLQKVQAQVEEPKQFEKLPEPMQLEYGDAIYTAPEEPKRGQLLVEEVFQTTLEDSNLVGNVYFSNYARWQGIVRDTFFYQQDASFFRGTGEKGELLTSTCEVEHLREAMPFDSIVVRMYMESVTVSSVSLRFEYFRQDNENQFTKLAIGKQTAVWAIKNEQAEWQSQPWPEVFKHALLKDVDYQVSELPTEPDVLSLSDDLLTFID